MFSLLLKDLNFSLFFDEQHDAVQIYFSKFVPIVASETVHSTNSVFGLRRIYMLLPLVLLANNDCSPVS